MFIFCYNMFLIIFIKSDIELYNGIVIIIFFLYNFKRLIKKIFFNVCGKFIKINLLLFLIFLIFDNKCNKIYKIKIYNKKN